MNKRFNGYAIALAWPETKCKQTGAWYDVPMKWINFNKNNYYKVGHAAIVLVDKINITCHYFDFGRYHSPVGFGRVRNKITDHDLEITTKPIFEPTGRLSNLNEILKELKNNNSCHGDGNLHASLTEINFEKAYEKALFLQQCSPLPYGPFDIKGTNCSRFVNSVLISGNPSFLHTIQLLFPITLTPTPIGNVKSLSNYIILEDKVLLNLSVLNSNFSIDVK